MRNLRFLWLAVLLLGGQYALLVHAAEHMDADHPQHACEVCLHATALDHGIAPSAVSVASPVLAEAPLPECHTILSATVERLFDARGPPAPFSA